MIPHILRYCIYYNDPTQAIFTSFTTYRNLETEILLDFLKIILWEELVFHITLHGTCLRGTSMVSLGLFKTRKKSLSREYVSSNVKTWGPHSIANWFFDQVLRYCNGGKNCLLCFSNWISINKKIKSDPYFSPYIKLILKWLTDIYVRDKTCRGKQSHTSSQPWIRFLSYDTKSTSDNRTIRCHQN